MHITMLMPNAPGTVCGLSDHGVHLADALREHGFETGYLARHVQAGESTAARAWNGTPRTLAEAIRHAGSEVLWVQYSGYGFSRKSIPFDLARGLEGIRSMPEAPLIVVFVHETHANLGRLGWRGPLVERLQASAAGRVARSADIVFASVEANLERCIDEYGVQRENVSLLPIASNIPVVRVCNADRVKLRERLGLATDARIAVVFGLWSTQQRALTLFEKDLCNALREGRIDHVLAIGGETRHPPGSPDMLPGTSLNGHLTVYGPAAAANVGRVLGCCDIGLVATPRAYLGKSGVAAAFASAKLELWLKNERAELVVEAPAQPRPTWREIAHLAGERISQFMEKRGHPRR